MKIVFIGYRAAGKSTLGQLVAHHLGWPYQDIDRGIEIRCKKPLAEFFKEDQEHFRAVETEVVLEMCRRDQTAISFGAGSLIAKRNQEAACRDSLVVYLKVPVEELWRRIDTDPDSAINRPNHLGGGIEEVAEMLARREPVYLKCADLILDATRSPEHLAEEVIAAYRARTTQPA